MRRARTCCGHTFDKQFRRMDAARIARQRLARAQNQQRHDHGARPIAHLGKVNGKPARQQDQFRRHGGHIGPRRLAIEAEQDAGEDIGLDGAAARADRLAGACHVRRVDIVADHLEREIGFHRRGDIESALVIERPAAMRALDAAQIDADLLFQFQVRRLGQVMHQQDVFGRNGGIGLQLIDPVPIRPLLGQDGIGGGADRAFHFSKFSRIELVHVRTISRGGAAPKPPRFRRSAEPLRWWRAAPSGPSRRPGTGCASGSFAADAGHPAPGWRRRWRAFP